MFFPFLTTAFLKKHNVTFSFKDCARTVFFVDAFFAEINAVLRDNCDDSNRALACSLIEQADG